MTYILENIIIASFSLYSGISIQKLRSLGNMYGSGLFEFYAQLNFDTFCYFFLFLIVHNNIYDAVKRMVVKRSGVVESISVLGSFDFLFQLGTWFPAQACLKNPVHTHPWTDRHPHGQTQTPLDRQTHNPWTDTHQDRHPSLCRPSLGRHPLGKNTPWRDTPLDRYARADTPAPRTATAADGMHPTRMHSCFILL